MTAVPSTSQSSSVIFSLQELARMEDERVRGQAEATRLEQEARQAERQRAEALEREALEARAREEEEKRRQVERAEHDALARMEATTRAAVEAARVVAEGRLRAEERERERRFELENLAVARAAAERSRASWTRTLASAFAGASVAALLAGVAFAGVLRPAERAEQARWASELAARDALLTDARAEAGRSGDLARSMAGELAAAKAEAADLRQKLLDARPERGRANLAGGSHVARTAASGSREMDGFSRCPPGSPDPMCAR
jgi:hypothetical protein